VWSFPNLILPTNALYTRLQRLTNARHLNGYTLASCYSVGDDSLNDAQTGPWNAVQGHGIGIPATAVSHLFTRFYRADNAEMHYSGGMGIGLAVVKEIVSLHDGDMQVESVEGAGSTFTIHLPLTMDEAPIDAVSYYTVTRSRMFSSYIEQALNADKDQREHTHANAGPPRAQRAIILKN